MTTANTDPDPWDITHPYSSKKLDERYRRLLKLIGTFPSDTIAGAMIVNMTEDIDTLRTLVAWNFLGPADELELPAYEHGMSISDGNMLYRITHQAREFSQLQTNNVSELRRAILILLRASVGPDVRSGDMWLPVRNVQFYNLVVLLDQSEQTLIKALDDLQSLGLAKVNLVFREDGSVWKLGSDIQITNAGITFLEHKGGSSMKFININIPGTVGVFAFESTLTNIDANVGNLKQQGITDFAELVSKMTSQITNSSLEEEKKKDALEQVELITEEARKEPKNRKLGIVKGALSVLEKTLSGAASLATLWVTCSPSIRAFFNM